MLLDDAILNPFKTFDVPSYGIASYTKKIIDYLINKYDGKLIGCASKTDIYSINYNGKLFTTFISPIGSSASSMVLEELIACGLKKIVYFGSCGVLGNINSYDILIPLKSLREEGTSYHYIERKKYIPINTKYRDTFIDVLREENLNYHLCATWTTDAPYRETYKKRDIYLSKGISCVDMEASALSTIGIYRGIDVFIFFYAADSLSGSNWDKRCLGLECDKKYYFGELALIFLSKIID